MNRVFLILFAVFAGTVLLTQVVSSADGAGSEAREKAKQREKSLVDAKEKAIKDKKTKALQDQKNALDATPKTPTIKEPKGKSAADSANAARLKVIKDAKAAYDVAKTSLDTADKAYKGALTDATKKQAYLDAKKAFEKARIDRELAKHG